MCYSFYKLNHGFAINEITILVARAKPAAPSSRTISLEILAEELTSTPKSPTSVFKGELTFYLYLIPLQVYLKVN